MHGEIIMFETTAGSFAPVPELEKCSIGISTMASGFSVA